MIPVQFFTGAGAAFWNTVAWITLFVIPPLIVLLYFLKLKRQPVEVPSTYLWHRTIEDLHVNSIWQRLRRSLLLLLQLLLLLLLILSCFRPGWQGAELVGDRFIFLVDNSASMSATDVDGKSRLDVTKDRIEELIGSMKAGDVAMILRFSDGAETVQSFTDNRSLLRRKLRQIQPSNRVTDLRQALRTAEGLGNPTHTSVGLGEDGAQFEYEVEPPPATMYIFSDGGFPPVTNFKPGNLTTVFVPVGDDGFPSNFAVVAFSTDRNPEKPAQVEAFYRLENYGDLSANVNVSLFLDGVEQDSEDLEIPAAEIKKKEDKDGNQVLLFEAPGAISSSLNLTAGEAESIESSELKLVVVPVKKNSESYVDRLPLDNVAYAVVNKPRKPRVLLVSPGNDPIEIALRTFEGIEFDMSKDHIGPKDLESKAYQTAAGTGAYDVIIYDRCVPKIMPQANTLFIGAQPPMENWKFGEKDSPVIIVDTDRTHPLMALIETSNIWVYDGFTIETPPGGTTLMDASIGQEVDKRAVGSVCSIAPRQGFEDAVLGFEIIGAYDDGKVGGKTDWPRRLSFPIFMQNVVTHLGGAGNALATPTTRPGDSVVIRSSAPVKSISIELPSERREKIAPEVENRFEFTGTDELGIYRVREGSSEEVSHRFAVNLFDIQESNLQIKEEIPIGQEDVKGQSSWQPARKELWKWLLIVGLCVLIFEWYVYNRRVYL